MRRVVVAALLLSLHATAGAQGWVCAIGGGGEGYNAWSDAPYRWIVQRADSQRICILSANAEDSWLPTYFRSLGADSAFNFMIATPAAANDSATYQVITACRGVFIKGGDQWDYVRVWRNTLTEDAIRAVFLAGGVVAGTSAGAAVLGEIVFDARYSSPTSRPALRNPRLSGLTLTTDFLGLVPGTLFDTHFTERARFGRLLAMMGRYQADTGLRILGVGLETETALCIAPDGTGEVMGAGAVVFYAPGPENRLVAAAGEPLVYTGIRCDALVAGFRYNLLSRQVTYVPPTATTPGAGGNEPVVNELMLFGDPFPGAAALTRFIDAAGGLTVPFAVIVPPTAAAPGQRFVDTLTARGAQTVSLVQLDASSANSPAIAAAITQAEGIILTGNAGEQFPVYADTTTLAGQALRERLHSGVAAAFAAQDAKLAGSTAVFRTELEELASIRGKLTLGNGLHAFRNLVVMPLIFQSDVYDENRMAGLPWGMAMRNGKTGIYLDEGSTVSIDASGVIRSEGPTPAVILDARNATAVGFSTYRHSGSIGPRQSTAMVGATVQVIAGDYRYDALSGSVITNVAADVRPLPVSPTLLASYPNPFNSETTILFGMGAAGGRVRVAVYDIVGRRVATLVDDERPPGTYTVRFSCNGCSSGVYIVRCDTPSGSASRVLLLLR